MTVGSDTAILARIERAVAQNLLDYVRAVQTVAPEVQADVTACAGGIAAFTGIGSPLTSIKGAGPDIPDDDVDAAEAFFQKRGVKQIVFELAPWIPERSVERLLRRGYRLAGVEDVVVRSQPFDAPMPLRPIAPVSAEEWPALQLSVNDAPDTPVWSAIIRASAQVREAIRLGVRDESGQWIACAELFPVGDVALFANDATLESARGLGVQTAAIHHRLGEAAARGFVCVAAEVAPGSTSERNYLRCGFQRLYGRSHYVGAIDRGTTGKLRPGIAELCSISRKSILCIDRSSHADQNCPALQQWWQPSREIAS